MFKSIKKAFGFVDDDELISDDPEAEAPSLPAEPTGATESASQQPSINADRIFSHVVEVFNASLPGFLKAGANAEAQRRYLYDTLSADIKAHLDSLEAQAREACESRWRNDRDSLNQKVRQIEARSKELEEKKIELSQKQLSADRQKRALSDRVHDLEKQLSKLAADREQYDLENKSLVNKLKVAGVFEKENEELRDELNRLQAENLHMRNGQAVQGGGTADSEEAAKATARAEEAEAKVKEAEKKLAEAEKRAAEAENKANNAEKLIAEAEKRIAEAENKAAKAEERAAAAEKETLETAVRLEELEKHNGSDADKLREQLNQTVSDKKNIGEQNKKLSSQLESLRKGQSEAVSTIENLKKELDAQQKTIETLRAEAKNRPDDEEIKVLRMKVAEAEDVKSQIEAIESQISAFQDLKIKKDQQIAGLKDELAATRKELAAAKNAIANAAAQTDKAQKTAAHANDGTPRSNPRNERPTRRQRKGETQLDDILSDTDWLVAPPSRNSGQRSEHKDRNHHPDNDSQLSLF